MAVIEADEAARGGSSSGKLKGNASDKTTDAASACKSFWNVEAARAGATGAEGASGFTQHARVEHCLESQRGPQQFIWARRAFAPVPADPVKTPCQARTNPSTRTTAIFTGRNVIAAIGGFGTRLACRRHPAGGKGGDRTRTLATTRRSASRPCPASGTLAAR